MNGKALALVLVAFGLIAGAAMYYLQVYAFYDRVALAGQGGAVELKLTRADGTVAPLAVADFQGIDSQSSPIRFRACFTVDPALFVGAQPYPGAVPLNAPGWFDCFDAAGLGAALADGTAQSYLGETHVLYGIDRVIAVLPDGRAFAWHQINECGKEVFDGNPPPAGCPLPPQGNS